MDYIGILKRAYEITIKHRYLWIFGILAGGAWTNFNFSLPQTNGYSDKWVKSLDGVNNLRWESFLSQYWGLLFAVLGLILILGVGWIILSLVSTGALLGSVQAIEKNETSHFRLGFAFGWHKFWRTFAVGLLIATAVIISIIVLALPVVLFVLAKIYVLAVIYGLLIFLLDLIFWLYLSVMSPYILREAILGGKGAWEAITTSREFFSYHWKEILIFCLLLWAVGIALGIGLILAMLLVGGLLAAIGVAIFLASQFIFWIYLAIFGLIFVVFAAILGGMIGTFGSTAQTLLYLKLVQKA